MNIFSLDIEKQKKIGFFSGIFSIISFFSFISLSFLLSIDKYNPFTMTISKLGITTNSGAIAFIIGTVLGGSLISIYASLFLRNILINVKYTSLGVKFGIFSGLALIGVGIIQDKPDFLFQITHAIFAGIFFFSMSLSILLISIDLRSNNTSLQLLAILGFVVTFITICHFFISFFKENLIIFSIVINLAVVWQKITVFSFIIWQLILLLILRYQMKLES